MERPRSKLADLKLVSKYYPVVNYSYPDRRSHNGPSRSSTDRTSLGSEGSAPGLVDDQAGSETSLEDDYQYHAHANELWDTFWQPVPEIKEIKEEEEEEEEEAEGGEEKPELRARKSYPALTTSSQQQNPRGPDEARNPAWPLPETYRPRFRKASATYSPFPRLVTPPRTTSLAPSWQCSRSKPVTLKPPFDEESINKFVEEVCFKRPRDKVAKEEDNKAVSDSGDKTAIHNDNEPVSHVKPIQAESAKQTHDEVVKSPQPEVAKHTRDQVVKPIQFKAAENTMVELTTPTKIQSAKRIRDEAVRSAQAEAANHSQHAVAQHFQDKTTMLDNMGLVPPPLRRISPPTANFVNSSAPAAFVQVPRPATARERRPAPLDLRPSTPTERRSPMGSAANHSTASLSLPDPKPVNYIASKKSVPCLRSPPPRPNPEPQLLSVFEHDDTDSESESESSPLSFFRFHRRGSSDGRRSTKSSQWGHRRRRTNASTAPTSPTVERPARKRQGSDVLGLARMLGLRSK
ncbi:hypothetical protein AK830_g11852 [Neonectria ditissima]|uniref:Uncharacterized protein n=1 Tax=Neonectria ditissima TaxID=78410 RepID=A0A0P7B6S8_9HYPO|nr:hypothetical protein AK830_g11852 [Neonectria ditissima]